MGFNRGMKNNASFERPCRMLFLSRIRCVYNITGLGERGTLGSGAKGGATYILIIEIEFYKS